MTTRAGRYRGASPLLPSKACRLALSMGLVNQHRGRCGQPIPSPAPPTMGPSVAGCFVGPVGAVAHDIPSRRPLPRLITKDVNRGTN